MAHDLPEHVVKIFPRVDIEIFAGYDESHEQSRRPAAPLAVDKKLVLVVQSYRRHRVFSKVIVCPIFRRPSSI